MHPSYCGWAVVCGLLTNFHPSLNPINIPSLRYLSSLFDRNLFSALGVGAESISLHDVSLVIQFPQGIVNYSSVCLTLKPHLANICVPASLNRNLSCPVCWLHQRLRERERERERDKEVHCGGGGA